MQYIVECLMCFSYGRNKEKRNKAEIEIWQR